MPKNFACFVLSTGRCGTQWLHHIIHKYYGSQIRVTHEPLDNRYNPRQQFHHKNHQEFLEQASQEVKDHIQHIKSILDHTNYLETGFPVWSSIPYLLSIFKGRVKIVFLTRHPVSMAKSWMKLGAFIPPILAHQVERVLLSPFDDGVQYPQFKELWKSMEPFEKLFYYWLEVNTLGKHVSEHQDVPVLHIKFEELFQESQFVKLLNFLDLPFVPDLPTEFGVKRDRFNYLVEYLIDDRKLLHHPSVDGLAKELGYWQ